MAFITNKLRKEVISSFIRTFAEDRHYMFAAKSLPFSDDNNPDEVDTSDKYQNYDLYREMVFGKYITASDIVPMTKKVVWEPGVVYDFYDDKDVDLETRNFIITSLEADGSATVFKCINNRLNGVTVETSHRPSRTEIMPDDEFYMTNDGYVWKMLYNVSATLMRKFTSQEYIPVIEDPAVKAAAVSGSIDSYIVEAAGEQYNSWVKGSIQQAAVGGNTLIFSLSADPGLTLSSNSDFYSSCAFYIRSGRGAGQMRTIQEYIVTGSTRRVLLDKSFDVMPDISSEYEIGPRVWIKGDGEDAVALAIVNPTSNNISHIEVVDPGRNYSYADVYLTANTGVIGNTSLNAAEIRPIIAPYGGHGSDPMNETFSSAVCVSVSFAGSEGGRIPTVNEYRTFGILKSPIYNRIELEIDAPAVSFMDSETVTQADTGATGKVYYRTGTTVILTEVKGRMVSGKSITGSESGTTANVIGIDVNVNYFDQRVRFTVDITDTGPYGQGFVKDEKVTQFETGASGYVHQTSSNTISLIGVKGEFSVSDDASGIVNSFQGETSGAVAKLIAKKDGDLVKFSGKPLYIENTNPITRTTEQTESIKVVLDI